MRSNGLATILLMIPVIAVPALAIFGIPQFAPVVASPLDEGHDFDRESRVGNSERPAHDELFGELDGFSASHSSQDKLGQDKLERRDGFARTPSKRKLSSKSVKDTAASEWEQELEAESDWPSKSRRRGSAVAVAAVDEVEAAPPRTRKRNALSDRSNRSERRESAARGEQPIRLASAVEEDLNVETSSAQEEQDPPARTEYGPTGAASAEPRRRNEEPRREEPRREEPRRRSRVVASDEPLTWKSAVERLNELEIRNFRLEPGNQNGQFVFICSYTAPDTPRVSYRFEAGADEPLKAVEKVLDQIVEWQQRR